MEENGGIKSKGALIVAVFFVGMGFASLFYFLSLKKNKVSEILSLPRNNIVPEHSLESPPSLSIIFQEDHSWTATLSADKKITLLATGDIIPARTVNHTAVSLKNFRWPYERTNTFLQDADITFINLETSLMESCIPTLEGMIFCGSARNTEGLVYSGVDVVSVANNHAGNYGEEGVAETVALLQKSGMAVTGIEGPVYKEIKGVRFAFLGYNDITTPQPGVVDAEEEKIKNDIQNARSQADIVVVAYHWGVEYRSQPDDRQKYLGRFTIDAGADLVIGNHPHWIQPLEVYHGKIITYAHGNFVFDQMWSQKTQEGVVGKYIFYNKKLADIEYFPVLIENYGQPRFLEGEEKKKIVNEMKEESAKLASE